VFKTVLFVILGVIVGLLMGFLIHDFTRLVEFPKREAAFFQKRQIVGFLPYWLLDKAKDDYSKYINTLTYFGLTLDADGKILKLVNEQETEPGWLALKTGKVGSFFLKAREKKVSLSLLVFLGDKDLIDKLMENPIENANNLVLDVEPIMKDYGFSDLNIDIEKVDEASDEQRANFTKFATEVKKELESRKLGTLTVDISPSAFLKKYLIDPVGVARIVDHFIVMAYDYHFANSYVSGPVAPLAGTDTVAEFDIQVALNEALKIIPSDKIILGVPLYGYEWETIGDFPRAAVIPASGQTISNNRAEQLLKECSGCEPRIDTEARESFLIYKDGQTGTYHQVFYPDTEATNEKIDFSRANNLAGIALWALGYEGEDILNPLLKYK